VKDCRSDLVYEFKALNMDSSHGLYTAYDRLITDVPTVSMQNYLSYAPMATRSTSKAFAAAVAANAATFPPSPYDNPFGMTPLTSPTPPTPHGSSSSSSSNNGRPFPPLTVATNFSTNMEPPSPSASPSAAATPRSGSPFPTTTGLHGRSNSTGSVTSNSNSPLASARASSRTWNQRFQDALDMPEASASQTLVKYQVYFSSSPSSPLLG
jgi:hypothetical protein